MTNYICWIDGSKCHSSTNVSNLEACKLCQQTRLEKQKHGLPTKLLTDEELSYLGFTKEAITILRKLEKLI